MAQHLVQAKSVQKASIHILLPTWRHIYALPFISIIYPNLIFWLYLHEHHSSAWEEYRGAVWLVAGLVNALLFLACHWSTNLRVLFTCHRACLTYISYKRVIYVIYVYVICFNYYLIYISHINVLYMLYMFMLYVSTIYLIHMFHLCVSTIILCRLCFLFFLLSSSSLYCSLLSNLFRPCLSRKPRIFAFNQLPIMAVVLFVHCNE
jgi:hypothetical protein